MKADDDDDEDGEQSVQQASSKLVRRRHLANTVDSDDSTASRLDRAVSHATELPPQTDAFYSSYDAVENDVR